MDHSKNYDIVFVGQDYQPLSKAVERAAFYCDGIEQVIHFDGTVVPESEADSKSDPEMLRRILDVFLEEVAPNGICRQDLFVINSSGSSRGKRKLFDPNFSVKEEQGYFGGLVGVIKKDIKVPMGSFLTDADQEETEIHVTLQIKSRLDVDENGNVGKPFFLSTMLLKNKLEFNDNMVPNSEDEIFDYLLLFWFKEQLQRACLKGYYKTYRRFEKNDDRVKGTIDVARHIRLNAGQKNGKIAYSYRENTIDNYLNQLIVAAYKHLKNKYYELVTNNFDNIPDLKRSVDFLSNEIGFSGIKKSYLINKNTKTIAHPYFTEYEELRQTCLKILRDEAISIFDGSAEPETQGMLFYLPDLWETFLEDEVIGKGLPKDVTYRAQFFVRNFGYLQKDGQYDYRQESYPDYVLFTEKMPFMILDAKCKPKWEGVFEGSSVSEVMEDYNKCIRDMVAIDSHATGVMFPTNRADEVNETVLKHPISEYNKHDFFYTIPIQVPHVKANETYSEWLEKFTENLEKGRNITGTIIQKEKTRRTSTN